MKKTILISAMVILIGHFSKAQNHNTLWCDKNPKLKTTHHINLQKTTVNGKLNAIVKWGAPNGGSTLSAANLEITNATCESCTPLGAIGSKNYQQNWVFKVTDITKPVVLAWKGNGTISTCGTGKLNIPAAMAVLK